MQRKLKDLRGWIEPFVALKQLLRPPRTLTAAQSAMKIPANYRGFHANKQVDCIGCASCQDVCMNEAIDMVALEPVQNPKNKSGLVPRIDYGRCCWCALCSDVCPTNSLQMTPEFLMVSSNANAFLYMPKDQ